MSEKIQALRMVLVEDYGWEEKEVLDYNKILNLINEDYLVLNENEVRNKCIEYLEEYVDSCGYIFSNIDLSDYANEQFFEDYYRDYYEMYIEDIKYEEGKLEEELKYWKCDNEEELLEKFIDDVKKYGYINDFIFNYGNEYFIKFVKEFPECIDKKELFEDIIRYDGAGNILSSYDGIEHEVKIGDNFYYVYRIN